ncbi:MAG: hypothetical protein E2P02_16865 [Acidobacteria bacterium]|nr:MAG: hypothetical protein E2P02_16865 [Acidobacteriota bacterium]
MSSRRIYIIILGLFFYAFTANTQTLGQVAEKERDRRAGLGKKDASETITEAQLGSGQVTVVPESLVSEDEIPATGASDLSWALGDAAESAEADPWPELYDHYQTAYRDAKSALGQAEAFKNYCDEGTAPPERPGFVGWYWTVDCASMPDQVAQAQRSVTDIQTACHDHARRLRVPPGRARLQ